MSTFRTCWRVLFAQRTMILVYIVYLSLMMFGLSWSIIQNLSNTDNSTTYETLRPEVAVVDRNGGVGSGFSDSLRKFLSKDCDLVDVGTTSQDLQTAAASNYADLIVIIPEHYVDDLAAAFTSDSAVPELQMVTSFTGAYGSLAKLQVEDFLNLTRMTALADAASSGSSVSVASLNAAAGSVIADLTGNADAYPQIAIAEDPAGTDDREANGRYAFQTMMDMGAYPMVAAMFTITAMTMGSFSGARVRRRMYASPQRTGSMLFQQFACCGLFGVLVSLFYLALALALPVAAGLPITGVDPRGFLLCALTMVAYSLTAAASGFMVSMIAVNSAAINAIANVYGLVIMFTSGMAFPVDLMPKVMIVIGKCTPGWWFCRSISAAAPQICPRLNRSVSGDVHRRRVGEMVDLRQLVDRHIACRRIEHIGDAVDHRGAGVLHSRWFDHMEFGVGFAFDSPIAHIAVVRPIHLADA